MMRVYPGRHAAALLLFLGLAACDESPTEEVDRFLEGSGGNPHVGLVLNSLGRSLTLFHVGDPSQQREVPFGASTAVTPVGFSVRGSRAAVPLGNAASVALVDLETQRIARFFVFPRGNASGSAFADDTTVIAANYLDDYVGRFTVNQPLDSIKQTVAVAPTPGEIIVTGGRAFVVSANFSDDFVSLGNGILTVLDARTLVPLDTLEMGGSNSAAAALGPDGLLYVLNTRDYVAEASVTIVNPQTLQVVATVGGFGAGSGSIHIDQSSGLAFVSGFFTGTVIWDTRTRTFVRGSNNAVCAPISGGGCRGAFDAATDRNGRLYQLFFGSPPQNLPPRVFIYSANGYTLVDSVAVGSGPTALEVREF